jgi:flagellar basal-body rod protein FlgG
MRALKIAATGMSAQQSRVEVLSNNLANMSTTGFKGRRAEFVDLIYQQPRRAGAINAADGSVLPAGVQLGHGVRLSTVTFDNVQGPLHDTANELDLAIDGHGWFEVTLPNGNSAYTRDGGFKRNGDGQIVTKEGYAIVPDITIPEEVMAIDINPQGEVYAMFDDASQPELLGQVLLVMFPNDKGLEPIGTNMFIETNGSGPPVADVAGENARGLIRQGFLEDSAVDAVQEITDLIEAQRGYELNSKVISAADDMLAATTQIR